MLILYVETNLIMAIAKGRDQQAEEMLKKPLSEVNLIMPSLCYMEATVAWENDRKQKTKFLENLNLEINEESRKLAEESSELLTKLRETKLSYQQSINDFKERFIEAITLVSDRVNLIEIQKNSITKSFNDPILTKDKQIRDNLILQCILDHAQQYPTTPKALLTGNSQEFGQPNIKEVLQQVGINKYFSTAQNFLGWWESQK